MPEAPTLGQHPLNATEDIPDLRDYPYRPSLVRLETAVDPPPPEELKILDQGFEGACTGFALAAVINLLNAERGNDINVSPRMLYEMARRFDEWEGEDYSGSSCRGVIRGFFHMGVCLDADWPYRGPASSHVLTVERAKKARHHTLGAYYRVRPRISDVHAALNEVPALLISARVHEGWKEEKIRGGKILYERKKAEPLGGHAFALVGYNNEGFWVQNSWGPRWGDKGLALWSYEDWLDNVRDAWVLRLALPTPQIWALSPASSGLSSQLREGAGTVKRADFAGHFVHIDDGRFHDRGTYWSNQNDVETTASFLAQSDKYSHLMFYAHGGLNGPDASAKRIVALRDTFKDNGIYPYHFMWETGLQEELKDVVLGKKAQAEERAGGFTDWTDRIIELATHLPGRAVWREMKRGAREAFHKHAAGSQTVKAFLDALATSAKPKKIHLVAHSAGSILLAYLLRYLAKWGPAGLRIASCSLLAPAATVELFVEEYVPLLGTPAKSFGIDRLALFCLDDKRERDDSVAKVYRKSLLYLVSNAFEEEHRMPIVGMETFHDQLEPRAPSVEIFYSKGSADKRHRTASSTHGGFDNDYLTMNQVLREVLGKAPRHPFTEESLDF